MYALHAQILPAALVMLVLGHLFFVRLMGLYVPGNSRDRQEEEARIAREGAYHFYPDHLASECAVFLYLLLVIVLLALVFPATMGEPANPQEWDGPFIEAIDLYEPNLVTRLSRSNPTFSMTVEGSW